jgi:hypothetical protein
MSGAAPTWARFHAYDEDTYDGTSRMGFGSTPEEAIADYRENVLEEEAPPITCP